MRAQAFLFRCFFNLVEIGRVKGKHASVVRHWSTSLPRVLDRVAQTSNVRELVILFPLCRTDISGFTSTTCRPNWVQSAQIGQWRWKPIYRRVGSTQRATISCNLYAGLLRTSRLVRFGSRMSSLDATTPDARTRFPSLSNMEMKRRGLAKDGRCDGRIVHKTSTQLSWIYHMLCCTTLHFVG